MENERKFMETLTDTKTSLDEIKEQYKEINSALDMIEERRKHQKVQDQTAAVKTDTNSDRVSAAIETGTQDDGGVHQTDQLASDIPKTLDASARKQESKQDSNTFHENNTGNVSPQTDKRPRAGSTDDRDIKPKGILKKLEKGSKQSIGFKERLNLNFDHVMYGSLLRRTAVEMHQDNRLCFKFRLQPNEGSVYESKRPLPDDTEDMTAIRENKTRAQSQTNSWKSKQPSFEPERKMVRTSETDDSRQTSVNRSGERRTRISFTRDSKSEPNDGRRKAEKKQMTSERQKEATTVSSFGRMSKPVNGQKVEEMTTVVAKEQVGDLPEVIKKGEVSRDDWLNMLVDGAAMEGLDKDQTREMLKGFVDAFCGKGDTINLADFVNLSKDQYVESAMKMFPKDSDLDESGVRLLVDNFVGKMFGKNGKIDLLKCAKVGMPFMNKGLQALASGFVQGEVENSETSSSAGEDYENSEPPKQTPAQAKPLGLQSNIEPKNVEEEHTEESTQEDRVDIDPALWVQYANEEVQKGRVAQDVRERGMDTVICADVSQSMRGAAWQQATTFIKNFVEGIQNSTLMDDVYEHVALATYGSETRVQQHLTCDYLEIIRKLDRLKPSGPSPMYAGLQMVHAAVLGAGSIFQSNGYKMHPRVFLITDGKPTPAGMIAGPDENSSHQSAEDELAILVLVKEMTDKYHVTINPVPVGDFDLTILEKIANVSKGKIISPEDWRMQSRVFKNNLAAANVGGGPLTKLLAPGLARMFLDAVSLDASPEDKAQMDEFLRTNEREKDEDSDDQEIEDFPPLGSRVRRHVLGASIMTQSKHGLGTVTKHMSDGHIGVTWDEPNEHGTNREKIVYRDRVKGVTLIDQPRVLHEEMIAEGCRVRRGKNWHYGNQDGGEGNFGNVYCVKPDGIVKVRWDNGHTNSYMYGANGKFDLEIIGQTEELKKKEDIPKVDYTIPSDEETEDKRVQELNERNISIFDLASSDKPEVEGATATLTRKEGYIVRSDMIDRRDNTETEMSSNEKSQKNVVSKYKKDTERTARENREIDILNRKNAANTDISRTQQGESDSDKRFRKNTVNTRAKPKTSLTKPSEPNIPGENISITDLSGPHVGQTVQWMWQNGDTWKEYPPDVCEKIEADFKRNPRGTTLIRLNNVPFRVVFPRMEQINIETKDKYVVHRST